mgnify:CR=1 FL=1
MSQWLKKATTKALRSLRYTKKKNAKFSKTNLTSLFLKHIIPNQIQDNHTLAMFSINLSILNLVVLSALSVSVVKKSHHQGTKVTEIH